MIREIYSYWKSLENRRSWMIYTAFYSVSCLISRVISFYMFFFLGRIGDETFPLSQFILIMTGITAMEVTNLFITYYAGKNENRVIAHSQLKWTKTLQAKLLRGKMSQIEKFESGDIFSRMTNDIESYASFTGNLSEFLIIFPSLIAVTLIALCYDWRLCSLSIALCFGQYALSHWLQYKLEHATEDIKKTVAKNLEIVLEVILSVPGMRWLITSQQLLKSRFSSANQAYYRDNVKKSDIGNIINTVDQIFGPISQILFFIMSFILLSNGYTTLSLILALNSIRDSFSAPFFALINLRSAYVQCQVDKKRMLALMKIEEEDYASGDIQISQVLAELVPGNAPMIEFRDVSFGYLENVPVLDSVSFSITQGEKGQLLGSSGKGKTTIFRLLERFYEPQSGQILIHGYPIERINRAVLRQCITYMPQNYALFTDTIANNISLGQKASQADIIDAAKKAAIHETILSLPQGYQTVLADGGSQLSAGQRQRILLARAFLRNSPILLLDEFSSSLDVHTRNQINAAIARLAQGKTVLSISHQQLLEQQKAITW